MTALWCCYDQCKLCREEKDAAGGVTYGRSKNKISSGVASLRAQSGWGIVMTGDDRAPLLLLAPGVEEKTQLLLGRWGRDMARETIGTNCWCKNKTGRTTRLLLRLVPVSSGWGAASQRWLPGLKMTPLLKLETAAFWCRTQRRTVCLDCEAKLLTLLVAHGFGWS